MSSISDIILTESQQVDLNKKLEGWKTENKNMIIDSIFDYDVSVDLPDDALAKLVLIHEDAEFVVVSKRILEGMKDGS